MAPAPALALVAHDQMKDAMVAFARDHLEYLARFARALGHRKATP
jgi:methylglyoxal synthase